MPNFDFALFLTIEADDYMEAEAIANDVACGVGQTGENISAAFYEEDNSGQRVLYLHPEGTDNTWEPED